MFDSKLFMTFVAGCIAAMAVGAAVPAQAGALSASRAGAIMDAGAQHSLVTKVHKKRRYRNRWSRSRYHRYRRGRRVVDAPFAHVESGRRTVVDAPFTHVYVGRHGRRVVAPFVDLWLPY